MITGVLGIGLKSSTLVFSIFKVIKFHLTNYLGNYLGKSLHDAHLMKDKHQVIFQEYNATFPADLTKTWNEQVEKWNKDHTSKPDPYEDVENRGFQFSTAVLFLTGN